MVKSSITRYRLLSSLPKVIRKHYSLIMDPASGLVSVSVDTPRLDFQCLWQSISPSMPDTRRVPNYQNDLLGESWMGLEGVWINCRFDGARKRFGVDSDLRVQSVGVECDWRTFVRLVLALGVDPYNGGLLDLKRNMSAPFKEFFLKSSGGFPVMSVRKRENRVVASFTSRRVKFSLKTGLAWESGMVVVQDRHIHVMSHEGPLQMPWATQTFHLHSDKGAWPETAMEKALIWVLYAEVLYHESSQHPPQPLFPNNEENATWFMDDASEAHVLPVTQQILKTREDAIEELRLMPHLEASLNEIFFADGPLVSSILAALRQQWDAPIMVKNVRYTRPYAANPSGYLDIWDQIQGNDTFIALKDKYNPVPDFRVRSDADLTQLNTPMAVLARVMIALSSIQKWPRKEWSVQGDEPNELTLEIPKDPMDELLAHLDGYDPGIVFGSEEPLVYLE